MATTQQVIFKLNDEEYGIDIMKVYGIEKYQKVVEIPNTPPYIEGIINLRGEVLPIYSFRKKFNLEQKEADDDTKIIVTHANDMHIAFVVDSVVEILHIDEEDISETPQIITGIHRKYIKSVAKLDDRMIVLLDIDLIMTDEEKEEVREKVLSKSE